MSAPQTLFDKIWDAHVVEQREGHPDILYIDTQFIHEVTSPQAFEGLRKRGITVAHPEQTVATADHNVPTVNQHLPIKEPLSAFQVKTLGENCKEFGIDLYGLGHDKQGIVHVIGPELGVTQPGKTMVCGDSHTSTHGAFGAIAFGIGTSIVEQVLATQATPIYKPKTMRIKIDGTLGKGVVSISASGGTGYFVEFAGTAIESLSMEARMTICNMSIEMGARGGMIAPDQITFDYLEGREFSPKGKDWDDAVAYWRTLPTDEGASFDKEYHYKAEDIEPWITYGTNPGMGIGISQNVPTGSHEGKESFAKSLDYMGLTPDQKLLGKKIDYVFIGSCTKKADDVVAWIVPGSKKVEAQAQAEGLDKIFQESGFELRQPGCSACLAMNEDKVPSGMYCVSTSNRNFEGRQGPGSRTFLASPLTAIAAAVTGEITDVRTML